MENEKIVEYIQLSLQQGKSKEEIYKELLNQGWNVDAIQNAFNRIVTKIITKKKKEDIQKKAIRIIVTMGAIFVGAGIFVYIAANWQEMTKLVKVLIIVIAMIASYTSGWFFREKQHYERTGEALILLGAIIYGAGIFLVGQIFHIRGNWPDGFILWMIGVIAMAFAAESFSLFYLAILVGIISIIGHPFGIFGNLSGYNPFLLTSSFLLFVATIVTFITGWLMRKRTPPELKEFY
jgi:uncharacterized membrane protein